MVVDAGTVVTEDAVYVDARVAGTDCKNEVVG
jgi:hypothetical protein